MCGMGVLGPLPRRQKVLGALLSVRLTLAPCLGQLSNHNKILQAGRLKQQKFISHSPGGCKA